MTNTPDDDDRGPSSVFDSDDVVFTDRGGGFAYAPGEVIVRGPRVLQRLTTLQAGPEAESLLAEETIERLRLPEDLLPFRVSAVDEPLDMIEQLRAEGYDAQPNHVFFSHGCDCCTVHPADAFNMVRSGGWASPLHANPMRTNPMRSNPMRTNPMRTNSEFQNSAVPALRPTQPPLELRGPGTAPTIVVIDTGVCQSLLSNTVTGDRDQPDVALSVESRVAKVPSDRYLDPVAGHGSFIVGLIAARAPGCPINSIKLVHPLGYIDEASVVSAVYGLVATHLAEVETGRPTQRILNLSFGGPALTKPEAMRAAITTAINTGMVVVASAGNDATCEPQYPAAFDGVIAVGALGPFGPAPFTNFGGWVDACAPGTDLVSTFFHFDGAFPSINTSDLDKFEGWATWSGTSFAAPIVAAAVAREIVMTTPPKGAASITGRQAVDRVIRAPQLLRIPDLGTVVNL